MNSLANSETRPDDAYDAWSKCAQALKEHDDADIQAWKEEIDTLLVFAGLFSGVLTAFNVQLYSLLQDDSTSMQIAILAQISTQLSGLSVHKASGSDFELPLKTMTTTRSHVPPSAIRINALLFSSLICSLAAASMSILVKQWLSRYTSGLSSTSRGGSRLRQFRNDGFIKWRVATIIGLLPTLLQAALILFFAGLLELLWTVNRTVAIVATALVAMLMLFFAATIILPTFAEDCPYQTPQAFSFFVAANILVASVQGFSLSIRNYLDRWIIGTPMRSSWRSFVYQPISKFARKPVYYRWEARERDHVRDSGPVLDDHALKAADSILMDDGFLEGVIAPCIAELDIGRALSVFKDVTSCRAEYIQDGLATWHSNIGNKSMVTLPMMHLGLDMLVKAGQDLDTSHQRDVFRIVNSMWSSWRRPRILQPSTFARLKRLLAALHDGSFLWRDRYFLFLQIYETLHNVDNLSSFGRDGVMTIVSCMPQLRTQDSQYWSNNIWALFSASHLVIRITASDDLPKEDMTGIKTVLRDMFLDIARTMQIPSWDDLQPLTRVRLLSMILPEVVRLARQDHNVVPTHFVKTLDAVVAHLKAPLYVDEDPWTTERSALIDKMRELVFIYDEHMI